MQEGRSRNYFLAPSFGIKNIWSYAHNILDNALFCIMFISIRSKYFQKFYLLQREEVISMPRQDGTGPEGKGSITGRGAGKCVGRNKNQNRSTVSSAPLDGGYIERCLSVARGICRSNPSQDVKSNPVI